MTTPLLLAPLLALSSAWADEVPEHFVPESECAPRECTCDDAPMVEAFRDSQQDARDAWDSVRSDLLAGSGPRSSADAVRLFQSRFGGDPNIAAQFQRCEGYDPEVNKLTKIAGVSPLGEARLDPCFCDAFCKDVVGSTILHEQMHVPTIIAGVVSRGDTLLACSLGLLSGYACDIVGPSTLADSEVLSHDAGLVVLNLSVQKLRNLEDPDAPDMLCTWESLTPASARGDAPLPETFFGRLTLLAERLFGLA